MEWNEGIGTLEASVGVTLSLNLVAIWTALAGEPLLPLLFLRDVLGLEAVVGESQGSPLASLLVGMEALELGCRRFEFPGSTGVTSEVTGKRGKPFWRQAWLSLSTAWLTTRCRAGKRRCSARKSRVRWGSLSGQ